MTATTTITARTDPQRRARVALGWRVALVVVAALAVAIGLPAWGRTPLSLAAALVTADAFVHRYRGRGMLHAVLVAVGGAVVVLALLGLLLNLLPGGLTGGSWGIAVGLLELVVLVASGRRSAADPSGIASGTLLDPRRWPIAGIAWSLAVVAVLAGAVTWSAASFTATHLAPLAVAAEPSGGSTVVTVSAGTDQGPFELDLVTASGRTVLRTGITVGPHADAATRIALPAGTRGLVQLVRPGSTTALRQLVLDSTSANRSTP